MQRNSPSGVLSRLFLLTSKAKIQTQTLDQQQIHQREITTSTAPGDTFDYPPPPKTKKGETRIQCPYCLMPLDLGELENGGDGYWRRHVDEDLKPYVCLFPECTQALVFFTRRHEWKSHMENVHSIDWPRKVHTIIWYCDIDHNPPERFETESQWRKHMKNLDSHPKRQLAEPTKAQLDALSPRKQQVALRERFVCPLCEQIPEKIRPLAENGKGNPAEMYKFLVDHVANHIKSLSLMSLPCLDNPSVPLDTDGESIAIKDSFRRFMNEGSVPQPPSGVKDLDGVSLPPEVWSTLDRERLAALAKLVPERGWDREYSHYVHPDDPPESLDDEWVEAFKIWKEESDPLTQEAADSDPVITHLKSAKISADAAHVAAHTITPEDSEPESLLDGHAPELGEVKRELLEVPPPLPDSNLDVKFSAANEHLQNVSRSIIAENTSGMDVHLTNSPMDHQGSLNLRQTFESHSDWVDTVAFSPDGQLLTSGSIDNTIRIWDTKTGTLLQTLEGHSDWVDTVAFSPDGQLLTSCSYDKTLWDTAIGALKQRPDGHDHGQTRSYQAAEEGNVEMVQLLLDKGRMSKSPKRW
ncbi:hypothetical protein DL771_004406 [Monosporascus sp. 5C6A]|nr:hypothetical protein DL771_004406 [Monosporascus sp. 5C6A]